MAASCAACGAPLPVPGMLGDPQANTVAGAPVPAGERGPAAHRDNPSEQLRDIGSEIASVVSETITQRATRFSDRITRRSLDFSRDITHWSEQLGREFERWSPGAHHPRQDEGGPLDVVERVRDLLPKPPAPVARPRPAYSPAVYAPRRGTPALAVRAVWFLVAGSWLTLLWVLAIWMVLCWSVFGEQVNRMITLIPNVLTLRAADQPPRSIVPSPQSVVPRIRGGVQIAYRLLIGWWACLVWMLVAYALSMSVILKPVGYRMFSVTPVIAHL